MHAQRLGAGRRIVERFLRRKAIRHHDAADALRPDGVHRKRRAQRRIDAAGEAQRHAGKTVVDVVAQAQNAGRIIGHVAFEQRLLGPSSQRQVWPMRRQRVVTTAS